MSDLEELDKIEIQFPIVGIAASAGGLEAFTEMLAYLPIDTGMGFVLIQHLSPDYESLLPEILGRVTEMAVVQAADLMVVEPNKLYVIAPNSQMTVVDGILHLAARQKTGGKYLPADIFFQSLAADRGNNVIAVVLSGTDGDGSEGIIAIKVAGGITLAQSESSARFNSMPNEAVATGDIDFVLSPQDIAEELVALSESLYLPNQKPSKNPQELAESESTALTKIFDLLRINTGIDFSYYKPTTLNRRIQRRMILLKLSSLEIYAEYLQDHPEEVRSLHEEILIHVTSFFRDPEVFKQLQIQVFPVICQNKSSDAPIRIWVAGCSTGEEVYSIAIGLLEFLGDRDPMPAIQIFATDISETAIRKARLGFYLEDQMEEISPERRDNFFVPMATGGYQISSAIREFCVFARHNLGGDPPFSNLDLISCRNVLIYLSDSLQERIMPLFHYSLNPTGFLLLGTSESVRNSSSLFRTVHESFKIYTKNLTSNRPLFSFVTNPYSLVVNDSRQNMVDQIANDFDLAREIDSLIANHSVPVSVVVDDQMHIVQLRGDTDLYLKLPIGTTALNLFLMVREGLDLPLRALIYQAQTQNMIVRQEQVEIKSNNGSIFLNLVVIPFQPAIAKALHFLIMFEEIASPDLYLNSPTPESQVERDWENEIVKLRQALSAATQRELSTQVHIQSVIQEQSHLNQNLRVANEEILSSNEELQSTNEELQTAKEEIQSTNEELFTTNEELCNRNLQQNQDNSDLNNFIASISIPIVMLTNDLMIRRFTPIAQRLFNFIPADVGRPFSDIRSDFDVLQLEKMTAEVLEDLNSREVEIQTQSGYWYSLLIRPYRTTENKIDGATLVFLDINLLKRNASVLDAARKYAETIVETMPTPLVVLNSNFQINTANQAFYSIFQVSETEALQSSLFLLGNGTWNIPQLQSSLTNLLENQIPIQDLVIDCYFERIGQKKLLIDACNLLGDDPMILLLIEDITLRSLSLNEQSARQLVDDTNRIKDQFLIKIAHELRNPLSVIIGWADLLQNVIKPEEPDFITGLKTIDLCAKAQNRLIEDMLDVTRITSGKIQLTLLPIDLRVIVQIAIDTLQLLAIEKNIQIVTSLISLTIVGDSDSLQRVFWNLLANAIKFTPAGGQIEVTILAIADQAKLQFRDTGLGISAEFLPHIFEQFSQETSHISKGNKGLGLGMAIVKHLVELHGGKIQAESEGEGKGATITLWFPLAQKL